VISGGYPGHTDCSPLVDSIGPTVITLPLSFLLAAPLGGCPAGALPRPAAGEPWRLDRSQGAFQLRRLGADGRPDAEQSFPESLPCAALKDAVHVVLESWELSLQPAAADAPRLPPPPAPPPAVVVVTAEPIPPQPRWHLSVGAWVGGSATAAGGAPAAVIEATSGSPGGLLLRGALLAETSREVPIGTGACSWSRLGLALGPGYRWRRGRWSFDVGVDAWLALLSASGVDVPGAQVDATADVGLGLSAEAAFQFHGWAPFAALRPLAWLPDRAAVAGTALSVDIPSLELLGGLGVRWTG